MPLILQEVIKYFVSDSCEMHIPGRLISDGSFSGLCGSGNTLFHALRPGAVSCHLTCPLQRVVVEAVMDEYCQVQEFGMVN